MECKIYSSLDLYDDFILIEFKEFVIPKSLYLGTTRLFKPLPNKSMVPFITIRYNNLFRLIHDSSNLVNYTISNPSISFNCYTVDSYLANLKDFEFRIIMDYPDNKIKELIDYIQSVYDTYSIIKDDYDWWDYYFNEWKKSIYEK